MSYMFSKEMNYKIILFSTLAKVAEVTFLLRFFQLQDNTQRGDPNFGDQGNSWVSQYLENIAIRRLIT